MNLPARERAKVNAALLALHDAGVDPKAVTDVAAQYLAMGTPPQQAYEASFAKFIAKHPPFAAPLQRIGQLIEASDDRTIARYNVTMSAYIDSGDATAMQAMAADISHDMGEMALRTGDAGFADGLLPAAASTSPSPAPAPAETLADTTAASRPGWGATGYRCPSDNPE